MIDPTVTLGNLLTIATLIVVSLTAIVRLGWRFERLEDRVGLMWRWFKKVHGINGHDVDEDKVP